MHFQIEWNYSRMNNCTVKTKNTASERLQKLWDDENENSLRKIAGCFCEVLNYFVCLENCHPDKTEGQ